MAMMMLAGSATAAARAPEGRYRLAGSPDVASELILTADGHFAYGLSAGALDEHAEGLWTSDGTTVKLTTAPKPKPAEFSLKEATRTAQSRLHLRVTWPDGRGIAGVDFIIGFGEGEPLADYTQEYGWDLSPDELRTPRFVEFAIPMYQLKSQRFTLRPGDADNLTFVITPNDLGVVDFEQLPLAIGKDRLLMHRYGEILTYILQDK
jgi:hypothetical protein